VLKFHPSSVGLLMGDAQSIDASLLPPDLLEISKKARKTDAEKELLQPYKDMSLSAGAKTYLKAMASEFLFGYHKTVETKYMDKGLMCEDEAIEFLNNLWFQRYKKNTQRLEDEYLTGECDIWVPGVETIDTKVAWDLSTFPLLSEDAHDTLYQWQGICYMRLYDVPRHRVAFVLLDTPAELLKPWDQVELHQASHLPAHMRVTTITYERDMVLEQKLVTKLKTASNYLANIVAKINLEHREAA